MKTPDLTHERILRNIKEGRHREEKIILCASDPLLFQKSMAYAPRNKFFASESEQRVSMENRVAFLHVLQKTANKSGLFTIPDDFVKDFVERND